MTPPAATDAGPAAPSTTAEVVDGLRARNQDLTHSINRALAALGYVADDPCQPAQRTLLTEVIADLRAAIEHEVAR